MNVKLSFTISSSEKLTLPNFIGIGAPRSGTTWIYEMLRSHPSVFMSNEKELEYFNFNFHKGISWYAKYFEKSGGTKVIGEFSPTYLAHSNSPRRMRKVLPHVKLLACLRNPVEQIFSRYQYTVNRQMYKGTLGDALKEKPFLIKDAFYYDHLSRYLQFFPREQILVLIYEEIEKDPHGFMKKIFSFLDIDVDFLPENIHQRYHHTRSLKSRHLEYAMAKIRTLLRKANLHFIVGFLKERGYVKRIKEFNSEENRQLPKLDFDTRMRLKEVFWESNQMLGSLLQKDLSFWEEIT